jgi:hypothetical protein
MQMWMQHQVLSPGMQDAEEPNLNAKMLWISRDFEQRLRTRREQKIVKQGWVGTNQRIQLMRQGKHDVKVADIQQLLFSRREPVLACLRLALGAVPIPAGIIRDGLMSASRTRIEMAAQRRGATAGDSPQHVQLLIAEPFSMAIQEAVSLRLNNVGHLKGGPAHSGLWSLRERFN